MDRGVRADVQDVPPCPRLEYGVDLARWAGQMCHGIGLMVWIGKGGSWQKVGCSMQGCQDKAGTLDMGPRLDLVGWRESVDCKSHKVRSLRITWRPYWVESLVCFRRDLCVVAGS